MIFAFSSKDCQKIFDYSGKEMLAKEFSEFPNQKSENLDNTIWDLVLRINVEPYKEAFSKKSRKVSKMW